MSGLAAAAPLETDTTASVARVLQRYAQVLQLSLGRGRRYSLEWSGAQLYADLVALAASLARAQAVEPHAVLAGWSAALDSVLARYQERVQEHQRAQHWVEAVQQVLDRAALPTAEDGGLGGDTVALSLAHVLGAMMDERGLTTWQQQVQAHLGKVSERYWSGVFVCYDHLGVPRTNNGLEARFGYVRRQARRQSGFGQLRRPLLRHGAWLLYKADAVDVAGLQARLAQVPQAVYQQERARFAKWQARFQVRRRWQQQRDSMLSELEADWSHVCASFTQ